MPLDIRRAVFEHPVLNLRLLVRLECEGYVEGTWDRSSGLDTSYCCPWSTLSAVRSTMLLHGRSATVRPATRQILN
jgi:hypothetical protein